MPMGRLPKPSSVKAAMGNPGKRPINTKEPALKAITSAPAPDFLPDNVKEQWDYFASILIRMRVLTDADFSALEQLARMRILLRELYDDLRENGYTYTTTDQQGNTIHRRRPETQIYSDMDRRFRNYLHEFGLTPSSRSRIQVQDAGEAEDDPLFN